jgi:hypothetical protein
MAEYQASRKALVDNTARLRALRLAKEAADAEARAAAKKAPPKLASSKLASSKLASKRAGLAANRG